MGRAGGLRRLLSSRGEKRNHGPSPIKVHIIGGIIVGGFLLASQGFEKTAIKENFFVMGGHAGKRGRHQIL